MESSYILQLASLFLILFFFVVFFILYKRKFGLPVTRKGMIKEIERYYFSPKNYISIVKIGETIQILGITDNSISKVSDITSKELIDELILRESGNESKKVFSDFLAKDNKNFENLKKRLKKMRQNSDEKN